MELSTAFFLRLVAALSTLAAAHWIVRPRGAAADAWNAAGLPARETAALCILGFAAVLVPAYNPDLFTPLGMSALPGIWILLLLGLVVASFASIDPFLDQLVNDAHWLIGWGLCLAVPVTLFGQTDLDRLGGVQDGLWAQAVPEWGALFQPAAFALAVVALARWMAARETRSFSPRRSAGLVNGLLLLTTVTVFLGAWHVPWFSDERLLEAVGQRRALCALLQWIAFTAKAVALGAGARWLSENDRATHPMLSPLRFSGLCAINLVLTWIALSWRGA